MLSIQEQLLFTTLRINGTTKAGEHFIGTGFLLQRPVGEGKVKIYLVSNKHVLFNAEKMEIAFTAIGANGEPDIGKIINFPITEISKNCVGHPNPQVDIAIIECTGLFLMFPDKLFFKAVDYQMLATFFEPELSVAESVLSVGYPNNRYDARNNLPLIRQGMIASHPKYDYNGEPVFIIDAQVFPGSSGSPVYVDLTYENMKNGRIEIGNRRNIKLLGVVSQTMIRNNKLQAINTSTQLFTEEVLGLGIVFKATAIKELIDSMPTDN